MKKYDENYQVKTATRLRELRKEKGLSHQKLADKLMEEFDISISKDALMNYEALENHSRFGSTSGMRAEYLFVLAKFYRVSSDYILGLADIRTVNADYQAIHKKTGLSDHAIEVLEYSLDYGEDYGFEAPSIVNYLLEQEPSLDILHGYNEVLLDEDEWLANYPGGSYAKEVENYQKLQDRIKEWDNSHFPIISDLDNFYKTALDNNMEYRLCKKGEKSEAKTKWQSLASDTWKVNSFEADFVAEYMMLEKIKDTLKKQKEHQKANDEVKI